MAPTRIGRPDLRILPIRKPSISGRSSIYASSPLSSVTSSTRSFESSSLSGSASESGFFSPHTSYYPSPTSASMSSFDLQLQAISEDSKQAPTPLTRRQSSDLLRFAVNNAKVQRSRTKLSGTTAIPTPVHTTGRCSFDPELLDKRLRTITQHDTETAIMTELGEIDSSIPVQDDHPQRGSLSKRSSQESEFSFSRPSRQTASSKPSTPPNLARRLSQRWQTFTRSSSVYEKEPPFSSKSNLTLPIKKEWQLDPDAKVSDDFQKETLDDGMDSYSDSTLHEENSDPVKKPARSATDTFKTLVHSSSFKIQPLRRAQTFLNTLRKKKKRSFEARCEKSQPEKPASETPLYKHHLIHDRAFARGVLDLSFARETLPYLAGDISLNGLPPNFSHIGSNPTLAPDSLFNQYLKKTLNNNVWDPCNRFEKVPPYIESLINECPTFFDDGGLDVREFFTMPTRPRPLRVVNTYWPQ